MSEIGDAIKQCNGIIYIVGNGGSAANASHFASDLIKLKYRAISLADNVPAITMIANDYGYEYIFSHQLIRSTPDDVLIAMSVSGKSQNILKAILLAKVTKMPVFGLTGRTGDPSFEYHCDYCYHSASDNYQSAEDDHMSFLHSLLKELV